MRSGRNTGIILSQKLIELPVLNEKNQVDCIYAEQDANISSEIKALEKAIKKPRKFTHLRLTFMLLFVDELTYRQRLLATWRAEMLDQWLSLAFSVRCSYYYEQLD